MTDTCDILVCPDCGDDMGVSWQEQRDPVHVGMELSCDCGREDGVGQLFYPDDTFVLIANAYSGTCAKCDSDAMYRVQPVNSPASPRCIDHISGHLVSAYIDRPQPSDEQ